MSEYPVATGRLGDEIGLWGDTDLKKSLNFSTGRYRHVWSCNGKNFEDDADTFDRERRVVR